MIAYFLKKLSFLILSLFTVTTVTFFLMHAIPGDPFSDEHAIPEEIMQSLYNHYGLNEPLTTQYWKYLYNLAHLDFGPSFKYQGREVTDIIFEGFPVSLILGAEALFIALICGVSLGIFSAIYHSKWQDRMAMFLAVLGVSVPSFILATCLQYVFAIKLDLLPVARWGSFSQTILPAFSLAAFPTAFIARLTRSKMIEVLSMDYITTAKSKGLPFLHILLRHALRNAILPVVTYVGPLTASILTGSFVIEKIFGIPGLGNWFVNSISNRDYTMIMGTTLFYSFFLILCVFIVDILYALIDPRIQLTNSTS